MTDPETVRKGQLMEKYADAVSEEIRTSLRDAVPQLSATEFSELAKFHKTIDWSSIAVQCREKIRDKLGHQFDESWDHLCMKRKIALLEFLKRRTKNKDISQWRPHNKSPSDQCRPYIMDILNGKHHFLNQYLEGQQAKLIEDLVPAVDEYRSRIQRINEKRDLLMSQMERMDDTNRHNHEVLDDLEKNLTFLRQLNRDFTSTDRVTSSTDE